MPVDLPLWKAFHDKLKTQLTDLFAADSSVLRIISRVKTIEAINKKLERKKYSDPNFITDIVAFRIITEETSDLLLVYEILAKNFALQESTFYYPGGMPPLDFKNLRNEIKHFAKTGEGTSLCVVLSLGDKLKELSEWKPYKNFNVEVQITSLYDSIYRDTDHVLGYHAQKDGKALDRPSLMVASRLKGTLEKFEILLEKEDLHEKRDIHPFIKEHPFILHPSYVEFHSEIQIGVGKKYVMDFMIREADGSYLLVEIENAKHKIFKKNGEFERAVNHGIRQVEDWQQWIEENLTTIQRKYPDMVSPRGLVVIGRSKDLTPEERGRLNRRNINSRGNLTVCTYDELIEQVNYLIRAVTNITPVVSVRNGNND